jgi:cytochrome c oxidase subunit 3
VLSISAYLLRMQLADWRPTPKPTLLWINTGVLMLSSAALAWARSAADGDGDLAQVRRRLLAASAAALVFVAGQIVAWRELSTGGYGVSANPASSFFFLLTGLHAAHVLGGVIALGRTTARAWSGNDPARLRLGLALCNTYWDFLLVVWLILFGLLLLS